MRNFPNELEDENGNVVAIGKSKRERELLPESMIGETHKEEVKKKKKIYRNEKIK